ncbi:G-protein coupled receptor 143-like isoform X2 [Lycorma delicatula]|uniref:G-protein coupled receptor 143-like isoform X2 n=1 Tax=Lycorma delicatula TaxID=130591 RepID=UPI003F516E3C
MADPAIQMFCCLKPGKKSSPAFFAMMEFNSTPYNVVCLVSSLFGIIGATYQILPKRDLTHKHRWVPLVCLRGRKIIVWLAFADFLAALGVFVRSVVNLNDTLVTKMWDDNLTTIFCTLFAAWIQYWYCVTWMWTLIYTVDVGRALQDKQDRYYLYHAFCWTVPGILTAGSLLYLYYPNFDLTCLHFGVDNESSFILVLPNYLATYLPMISVMVLNPILYCYAGRHVRRMVLQGFAQYTNKEREIVDSTYLTFTLINLVFYICWLPNLISTIVVWFQWHNLPVRTVLILWYIMYKNECTMGSSSTKFT